jgi:hypothetical protein
MTKWIRLFASVVISLSLAACGGGSSSSSTTTSTSNIPEDPDNLENVALQSNGGTASASYDNGNADLVNDGDTNTATWWAGNATGDTVTVAFDQEYDIDEFTIYTNLPNNSDTELQISTDGSSFDSIAYFGDCDQSLSLGSGRIACNFVDQKPATHVRLEITDTDNPGMVQIHEIEAMGK